MLIGGSMCFTHAAGWAGQDDVDSGRRPEPESSAEVARHFWDCEPRGPGEEYSAGSLFVAGILQRYCNVSPLCWRADEHARSVPPLPAQVRRVAELALGPDCALHVYITQTSRSAALQLLLLEILHLGTTRIPAGMGPIS